MNPHDIFEQARATFERGNRMAAAGQYEPAGAAFAEAAAMAAGVWRQGAADAEATALAARLSADAAWSAGMAAGHAGDPNARMRAAILLGVEIYEREGFADDVRLHGLYRAQCAAFELAYARTEAAPLEAEELFNDAMRCAEGLEAIPGAEAEKVARVLANAAAAAHSLSGLERAREQRGFKARLELALELGEKAVAMPELRGPLQAETFLVLADVSYELAMTIEDQDEAVERIRNAIGWTREATEAPGADGLLQAEAMRRGANFACVYGLYLRNHDFEAGIEALEGAVALAMAVADKGHLPIELRAPAFDTAVRTTQNIALLFKDRDLARAAEAFAHAADLARRAAAERDLPPARRAEALYLAANALLEQGIITQAVAANERDLDGLTLLRAARDLARAALAPEHGAAPDVQARAALLSCGVAGRMLRVLDPADTEAIDRELENIEIFGQRAAETSGASDEHRATGASYAADAARRLAERTTDPRKATELRHRAEALDKLHGVLTSHHGHHH